MGILIQLIRLLTNAFILIVIVDVALSYFMSPWQPVRVALDKIVNPFLNPIRRIVPLIGMIDFSPIVLMLIIQLIQYILIRIVVALG